MSAAEELAEAIQDLLEARALSIGIIDIAVEVDAPHVDGEIMFGAGPDLGFSLDSTAGACSYCELVGDDQERWLGDPITGIDVNDAAAAALVVLQGLLDVRRPLLKRADG